MFPKHEYPSDRFFFHAGQNSNKIKCGIIQAKGDTWFGLLNKLVAHLHDKNFVYNREKKMKCYKSKENYMF